MIATPYFVADSANVTVMRTLASSAFGSYKLTPPEGIDVGDIYELSAPGNELGYVATLDSSRRVGGLARRFVRADVAVTAKDDTNPDWVPSTNVNDVLTESAHRVESDFFLESDISKAGLGPWVPLVDFRVGDRAHVDVWGQVVSLPVTRIEPVISEHDVVDWKVHLGGQLVDDEDSRLVENEALHKALLKDRRELESAIAAERKTRKEQAQQQSESIEKAAMEASAATRSTVDVQETSEDRQESLAYEVQSVALRAEWVRVTPGDDSWDLSDGAVATGNWVGEVLGWGSKARRERVDSGSITVYDPTFLSSPVPAEDGSRSFGSYDLMLYRRLKGEQRKFKKALSSVNISQGSWTNLSSLEFTPSQSGVHTLRFTVGWDAANRGSAYGIRVLVNGSVRFTVGPSTTVGPFLPLGDGYRTQSVAQDSVTFSAGDEVQFQVLCDAGQASQRKVRKSDVSISWIEEEIG